ncbi:hypothetical protein GCM10009863_51470 [Streptomyces axinellae]|uniref:DUF2637 domain-containing protein n=1 Tax=Streptomyces axinellae TaxID=552788 RepID=A0ABN3QLY9_9ACTN
MPSAPVGPESRPEDVRRIADLEQQVRDLQAGSALAKEKPGFDGWSLRVALAATIGLTASGEFALAELAGWARELAWLLPVSIDVYVVQAFRRHRDVAPALGLMVFANAVYHLAAAGLFGVSGGGRPEWWLIVGVAAIAPFVMWRIHRMSAPRCERRESPVERTPEAAGERPLVQPKALIEEPRERAHDSKYERPDERSSGEPDERQDERPERPQSERARKPSSERRERAQKKPKKSATASASKNLSARRRERARRLYDELGRRPEWTEIRDVLVAEKLAEKDVSRPTIQRVRDAIERDEPALAALGTDNVRALTNETKTA